MTSNRQDSSENSLGQPIGFEIPGWSMRERPSLNPITGRFCRVEPLDAERHAADLYAAVNLDEAGANWTYLSHGPFSREADYRSWVESVVGGDDAVFYAIIDLATERAVGVASLMRIDQKNGVIEVGNIHYSPRLQRHPAATESMYLLMRHVFDELGYRRYEWKCDDLNHPSRRAAQRLGFSYEGTFRRAVVYRDRNRDTAWFSIIEDEWPRVRDGFERWLSPENFTEDGEQRKSLADLREVAAPA